MVDLKTPAMASSGARTFVGSPFGPSPLRKTGTASWLAAGAPSQPPPWVRRASTVSIMSTTSTGIGDTGGLFYGWGADAGGDAPGIRPAGQGGGSALTMQNSKWRRHHIDYKLRLAEITERVQSTDKAEKIKGIQDIMQLVELDPKGVNLDTLVEMLQHCLPPATADSGVLATTAQAIGLVLRARALSRGAFSGYVKFEADRALQFLQSQSRTDGRRYAAVLILGELAIVTPRIFYDFVLSRSAHPNLDFFELLFLAIHDAKISVREASVQTFRLALDLTARRETTSREAWYTTVLRCIAEGLESPRQTPESVHGSLLALTEFTTIIGLHDSKQSGSWKTMTDLVLKFLDNKNSMIQHSLLRLLPILASFGIKATQAKRRSSTALVAEKTRSDAEAASSDNWDNFIQRSLSYLQAALKRREDRPYVLEAYGKMALVAPSALAGSLKVPFAQLKKSLSDKKRTPLELEKCNICVADMVTAYQETVEQSVGEILLAMIESGLTETLVTALQCIVLHIPTFRSKISARLLEMLKEQFRLASKEGKATPELELALRTLTSFRFGTGQYAPTYFTLLSFAHDAVRPLLSWNKEIRLLAGLACAHLILPPEPLSNESETNDVKMYFSRQSSGVELVNTDPVEKKAKDKRLRIRSIISEFVSLLLQMSMSDPESSIRLPILAALDCATSEHGGLLEDFFAEANNVDLLSIAVKDDNMHIRMLALRILGSLVALKPSHILPTLRSVLTQLLSELQVSRALQDVDHIQLLGHLIQSVGAVARQHVPAILEVLLPRLNSETPEVVATTIAALGQLARLGCPEMRESVGQIMPVIVLLLQDQSSAHRRFIAMEALSHLATGSGYVLQPYLDYPALMPILSKQLAVEQDELTRQTLLRLLGALGAPSPLILARHHESDQAATAPPPGGSLQHPQPNPQSLVAGGHHEQPSLINSQHPMLLSQYSLHAQKGTDDYFSSITINALLRIALDPSQAAYHEVVAQTFVLIFRFLQANVYSHLPHIIPAFNAMVRMALKANKPTLADKILMELGRLVAGVRHEVAQYAGVIVGFIVETWSSSSAQLYVLDMLVKACDADFSVHIPLLLPILRQVVLEETGEQRPLSLKVLQLYASMGINLDGWMHVVVPPVAETFEDPSVPPAVRKEALLTLSLLADLLTIKDFAPALIHAIANTLSDEEGGAYRNEEIRVACMTLLTQIVEQMGAAYSQCGFLHRMQEVLTKQNVSWRPYDTLVLCLVRGDPFPEITRVHARPTVMAHQQPSVTKLDVNQDNLQSAWEIPANAVSEDWSDWLKRFNRALLKESTSPAMRACSRLAETYLPLARELFNAAFVSCWPELYEDKQENLVRTLELALDDDSGNTRKIKEVLLSLAEFMEFMNRGTLSISDQVLGERAMAVRSFGKALHYKEREFNLLSFNRSFLAKLRRLRTQAEAMGVEASTLETAAGSAAAAAAASARAAATLLSPRASITSVGRGGSQSTLRLGSASSLLNATLSPEASLLKEYAEYAELEEHRIRRLMSVVEDLIEINNNLQQPEAASGVLLFAKEHPDIRDNLKRITPRWHERLGEWESALLAYNDRIGTLAHLGDGPTSLERRVSLAAGADASGESAGSAPAVLLPLLRGEQLEDVLGRMRCRDALGQWEDLHQEVVGIWKHYDCSSAILPLMGCRSAFGTGRWEDLEQYVAELPESDHEYHFYEAVLHVHRNEHRMALAHIDTARELLAPSVATMLNENYARAYDSIVQLQMLAELEEIVQYKTKGDEHVRTSLRATWSRRFLNCGSDVKVSHRLMMLRTLVLRPEENVENIINMSSVCLSKGALALSRRWLESVLNPGGGPINEFEDLPVLHPRATYMYIRHLWHEMSASEKTHMRRFDVVEHLHRFIRRIRRQGHNKKLLAECHLQLGAWLHTLSEADMPSPPSGGKSAFAGAGDSEDSSGRGAGGGAGAAGQATPVRQQSAASASSNPMSPGKLRVRNQREVMEEVLRSYATATDLDPSNYEAWHSWAFYNFQVVQSGECLLVASGKGTGRSGAGAEGQRAAKEDAEAAVRESEPLQRLRMQYAINAVNGFFRSISLNPGNSLQDALRLLTLWFNFGSDDGLLMAIANGRATVSIDTWLPVIPQFMARIDIQDRGVRQSIHQVLLDIGKAHAQALIQPLMVAAKSSDRERVLCARDLISKMRTHCNELVDQAVLVGDELIRVAVLWHEKWYGRLQDASHSFFEENNVQAMFDHLRDLHRLCNHPETLNEIAFTQSFGAELEDAWAWTERYKACGSPHDLSGLWDCYYRIFRRIQSMLPKLTSINLQNVSPKLLGARDLLLAVPGTYEAQAEVIRIRSFDPKLTVMTSKQRPRKLSLRADNGKKYEYLLKGQEDPRMDERVMALFGLINTLLLGDSETSNDNLQIRRYSITPLAPSSGLIGWVPNCDTLHELIRKYRKRTSQTEPVIIHREHMLMRKLAPDQRDGNNRPIDAGYDQLTSMQKAEVFLQAIGQTEGGDIANMLWLTSPDSGVWLERRMRFTRSLAVMSMVGYTLGLGDRHPSNIMVDRSTGQVLHIDFGDCFEIAHQRSKFPEKVPFRLTRMLVHAMEIGGIEGSYRTTCEQVMRVLRHNKDSLIAVLEALVHDPLLSWRIWTEGEGRGLSNPTSGAGGEAGRSEAGPGRGSSGEDAFRHDVRTRNQPIMPRAARLSMNVMGGMLVGSSVSSKAAHSNAAGAPAAPPPEEVNEKAFAVINRVRDKLTGHDFDTPFRGGRPLNVSEQVRRLIRDATDVENLSNMFIGWCAFW